VIQKLFWSSPLDMFAPSTLYGLILTHAALCSAPCGVRFFGIEVPCPQKRTRNAFFWGSLILLVAYRLDFRESSISEDFKARKSQHKRPHEQRISVFALKMSHEYIVIDS